MQPTYRSLLQVFGAPARYTVPLFQRPYVWNRETEWEPLWDDISNLADRALTTEPDKPIAGHFLGTVVLEQAKTLTGSIGRREIIDGQQRLTTLQILLTAAQHTLRRLELVAAEQADETSAKATSLAARQIAILTANKAYFEEGEKYKVWPTNDDREAFREVMDAPGPDVLIKQANRMAEAYRFFLGAISAWLAHATHTATRPSSLAAALQNHLRLIEREGVKGEPIVSFDFSGLEIEHILPQQWEQHWPLPSLDTARSDRERRLHAIGNLTLVNGKLNPSLSIAAWLNGPGDKRGKRSALDEHSKLQLNARLVKKWPIAWNEAMVDERASILFEAARQIWPPPPALGTAA